MVGTMGIVLNVFGRTLFQDAAAELAARKGLERDIAISKREPDIEVRLRMIYAVRNR